MKKILIAVDDSTGSLATIETFAGLFSCTRPETVVLVYVEKIEGRSIMDDMLGMPELSTLREQLKDTKYQETLDKKAHAVLEHYRKELAGRGVTGIKTLVKEGHPSDEILDAATEEGAEMIIIGSRGRRSQSMLMGSVSREVANRAGIAVLIAR